MQPGRAARLDPRLGRFIDLGNATGLGMAPFLVNHSVLIHNWVLARETALARVRALPTASPEAIARFRELLARARTRVEEWVTEEARQMERIRILHPELEELDGLARPAWLAAHRLSRS